MLNVFVNRSRYVGQIYNKHSEVNQNNRLKCAQSHGAKTWGSAGGVKEPDTSGAAIKNIIIGLS